MSAREWTHEELAAMGRNVRASIDRTEAEEPGVRPLPPMTEEECKVVMFVLLETAEERVLTHDEGFLFGQLIAQFRQAVKADMLGKKGRYYVISEEDVARFAKLANGSH